MSTTPKRRYVFTSQRDVPLPKRRPTGDGKRQPEPSTPEQQQAEIDQAFERLYKKLDERGEQK